MFLKAEIRKGEYYDSVKLMLVTQQLSSMDGIEEAAVQMGTNLNKEVLRNMGMLAPELEEATADDLMISIKGISEKAVDQALKQVDLLLSQRGSKDESYDYRPRSFDAAMKACPDLNLCIISVPGRYAKREAMKALEKGLHVMLFSDNVALEDELELKIYARNHNLLLMGPDCGTAMLNNIPLGFANKVRRGKIGIVGASGTGIQEVMTLIHKRGGGVSHAIGTGSRDLRSEIGGITTLQGLEALNKDNNTKVIVVISKPPAPHVAEKILRYIQENITKPTVVNFIGIDVEVKSDNIFSAKPLEEAALLAADLEKDSSCRKVKYLMAEEELRAICQQEVEKLGSQQRYIRGLYSGGTLCYESLLILRDYVGDVYSNIPLKEEKKLKDVYKSIGHTCIDFGEDEFTVGRPHPMIDTTLREKRLEEEVNDPEVAVILLDIVIGYGTHPDPAQVFADRVKKYKARLKEEGRYITFIASVCGTDDDPQSLIAQEQKLKDAGIIVLPSNATASRLAGMIAVCRK